MEIKILGPGCRRCEETARVVAEAVAASGLDARVEKVTDMLAIARYGVMATPAVVVDGQVRLAGKVPTRDEIRRLLEG